jgi:hypothetical protein
MSPLRILAALADQRWFMTSSLVRQGVPGPHLSVFVSPFPSLRPNCVPTPLPDGQEHQPVGRLRQLGGGCRTRPQRISFPTHGASAPVGHDPGAWDIAKTSVYAGGRHRGQAVLGSSRLVSDNLVMSVRCRCSGTDGHPSGGTLLQEVLERLLVARQFLASMRAEHQGHQSLAHPMGLEVEADGQA